MEIYTFIEFKECYELNNSGHIMNEKSLRFTMRSLGFSPTVEESIKYWNKYKTGNPHYPVGVQQVMRLDAFLSILYYAN